MSYQLALKGGAPLRTRPFTTWPLAGEEERRVLLEAFESGKWGFNGPKEQEFARRFAAFCGAKEGFCVANGSMSLEIALRALRIGPGDEVIVPALTWLATAWAVVQVGAMPVFADVREGDWCLDPASFSQKITPRTRAVIPVHLYNQMAQMDEILEIARRHSVQVVEDCAHTHGSRWEARGAGTLGAIGSYSFQQSKAMTAGEGGLLVTDDMELAARIYSLKNCGRKWKPENAFGFGSNYRMTDLQAALLLPQLDRLEGQLAVKAANEKVFREHLGKLRGVSIEPAKTQVTRRGLYGVAVRCDPAEFGNLPQELLVSALCAEGIPAQRPYDVVYRSPMWVAGAKYVKFDASMKPEERLALKSSCPVAERIAEEEGIVLLHHLFLGTAEDMADLAAGFEKVQRHAGELRLESLEKKARGAARSILKKVGIGS